jgi:AraC-like DNA-binding protein
LRHDVRRDDAAREMGVPSRQLSNWVKAAGYDSYSQWITTLRIDEAKRLIVEHRDWSIDAIADHCGISRQNFYKVFQEHTGTTPAKFHGE